MKNKLTITLLLLTVTFAGMTACSSFSAFASQPTATSTPLPTAIPTSTPVPTAVILFGSNIQIVDFDASNVDVVKLAEKAELYTGNYYTGVSHYGPTGGNGVSVAPYGDDKYDSPIVDPSKCEQSDFIMVVAFSIAFREEGIPYLQGFSLMDSESGTENFMWDQSGNCRLKQNYEGAPAYCSGQVYRPAHPHIDISTLVDELICARHSAKIYRYFYNITGNWDLAAAYYKGFANYENPLEVAPIANNFLPKVTAGGKTIEGIWVPYKEDTLDQILSDLGY